MADKIGRVFIEVDADIQKMNAKFAQAIGQIVDADGRFADTGKRMAKTVENALNPTLRLGNQITALGKAGVEASDQIKYFGDRLQRAVETAERNGKAIDPLVKQLYEAQKASQGAGSGFARLGQSLTDFAQNPLAATQAGITSMLEKMGPLAVGIGGIAAAAIAAGVAIFKMGSDAAEAAERIKNLSYSTGMSVVEVQALQRLGKETGVGDLTSKIELLNIQLGKPEGGEFTEAILRMNIAIKQGGGAVYYLEEIRKKLAEIPTQTERAEAGAAAFGRRLWHDLAPLVMNTSRSITESMSEIEKSSAVMTESQMEGLTQLDEELDVHGRAWEGLKNKIGRIAGEITLAFYKIIEAAPTWEKVFPDWYKPGAAAAVPKVPDLGAISPTTVQGRAYEDIAKENTEIERRLKVIAQQDAIATGIRGKLLDLTIKLREVEAERQKIANESKKGLEFQEERLKQLSAESALLKQAIAAEQARMEALKKSAAILEGLDRQYQKNVDATIAQQRTSAEAWQELDKIIAESRTNLDKFFDASETGFQKMKTDLDSLKFKELFPAQSLGQTPQEVLDGMIKINEQDRKNRDEMSKTPVSIADVWRQQVSTIVTDWSRGIADIIVSGQNFGEKLKAIFLDTAKGILRMMIEQLFKPLQNWLSGILNSLFGMGKSGTGSTASAGGLAAFGGVAGMATSVIGGGILAGITIPQTATGKMLGGIAGGVGGLAGAGAIAGATAGSGIGAGAMSFLGMIGPWGLAALGAAAVGLILYKTFTKNTFEAGAMEAARDFGGLNIGEKAVKTFITGLGLTGKQAEPIRKDLLTSPLFISQIAVPAAQAQGKLESFLQSLEKVTVDTKIAASGYLNFRAEVEQGIKTGNWDAFNKAWEAAFKNSKALTAVMPDLTALLAAAGEAAADVAVAVDSASAGFQSLRDSILASLPAAKDIFQTFWDTGEILPELSDLITKYGGDLAVFQKAAGLGQLRADLAGISDLMAGLNEILPEEGIIQRILGGKGFGATGWGDLAAMGLDPSKLVKIADLATFETGFGEARSQFEQTGNLMKGGLLEQALWQFGGAGGMNALQNYGQGFNTITPALLDSVQKGMDAAYKAERSVVSDYLKSVSDTMTSEIESASRDIVAELEKILWAIQNPGKPLPENLGGVAEVPAEISAAPVVQTTPSSAKGEDRGVTIIVNGSIYASDFPSIVEKTMIQLQRRGSVAFART